MPRRLGNHSLYTWRKINHLILLEITQLTSINFGEILLTEYSVPYHSSWRSVLPSKTLLITVILTYKQFQLKYIYLSISYMHTLCKINVNSWWDVFHRFAGKSENVTWFTVMVQNYSDKRADEIQRNEDDDYVTLPEKWFENAIIRSSEILRKIFVGV